MRRASQQLPRDRQTRRREWRLYAGNLKEFFGHTFKIGNQNYRIEGWIQRNPTNPIYAIREADGEPFVMSVKEVDTDTQYYALRLDKRERIAEIQTERLPQIDPVKALPSWAEVGKLA